MEIEDLNLPVRISQYLVEQLNLIGIALPLVWTQTIVLVLCVAASYYFIKKLIANGVKDLPSLLISIAFILFVTGILLSWLNNLVNPLPGEITGQITVLDKNGPGRYDGLYVELLDFNQQNIARERGLIDSRNGFFAVTYPAEFADYPRYIKISGSDCQTSKHPLKRSNLVSSDQLQLKIRCQEQQQ